MKYAATKACERPTLATESTSPSRTLAEPLLALRGLNAGYGASRVLHGLDLAIYPGETLVVMGRNGVGKTTLVETIMGLTDYHSGEILYNGKPMQHLAPYQRNRAGIGWVPQQREVFPSLTVEENMSVVQRPGHWTLERVFELFPRLLERRRNYGDQLSGGEQQMLALGRALVTNPTLLLLDEPVEGLAPIVVVEMLRAIDRMRSVGDMTILLVEQKYELALAHSERCVVIDHGSVVHEGPSAAMLADQALIDRFLGLSH
jgi:branched-chain amino acid transport system ATP-binding protein